MSEVYRTTDTVLKKQVALTILSPAVADNPERVARFQREAEVLVWQGLHYRVISNW